MVDLNKIVKGLKNKFSSVNVAENIEDPKDFVSTGNLTFDLISDGGIPFGYVIEFLGLSSSGKSLFIQQIIANAMQKYNAVGILVDRENAYTKERGVQLGINNDNLLIAKPNDVPTVISAFDFMISSIKAIREQDPDCYIVLGIDSISAFGKDTALEKSDQGRKAKSTHEGLREILGVMDMRTLLLVANQVTYKIGILYGDPRTTTAGESMKYYSNVRFALEDRAKIIDEKKGKEVVGNWIGIEVIKTRLGPCYRTCYLQHFYKTGIDFHSGYVRLLVDRNFLSAKNKAEFDRFKQQMVICGSGKEKETYSEHDVEKLLEKHPELIFEEYPEYNEKVQVEEDVESD